MNLVFLMIVYIEIDTEKEKVYIKNQEVTYQNVSKATKINHSVPET